MPEPRDLPLEEVASEVEGMERHLERANETLPFYIDQYIVLLAEAVATWLIGREDGPRDVFAMESISESLKTNFTQAIQNERASWD